MNTNLLLASLLLAAVFSSCKPKPIDIEPPQSGSEITISSATPDAHTIYVSAGYSISSMRRLIDTSTLSDYKSLPDEMLIRDGLVLLRADDGRADTLHALAPGLFGRKDLELQPGMGYSLIVEDRARQKQATAHTVFMPKPEQDTMFVFRRIGKSRDTLSRLHLSLPAARPGDRIVVCYNTAAAMRRERRLLNRDFSALYDFQPRRLEILRVPDSARNGFRTDLTLQVEPRDTVLVQVSAADPGFSAYLEAYKRGGSLFSQLSGEPVNLQGNVRQGYGYFSMYLSRSSVYDFNKL